MFLNWRFDLQCTGTLVASHKELYYQTWSLLIFVISAVQRRMEIFCKLAIKITTFSSGTLCNNTVWASVKSTLKMLDLRHGLWTPREEIAFTARPKIHSHSQIFRYCRNIFCLLHWPDFSAIFDLCLHWVSVVRDLQVGLANIKHIGRNPRFDRVLHNGQIYLKS